MAWQAVHTIPIRIDAAISPERAEAVRAALLTRALPLARLVDGRAEPLATASLVEVGAGLALLTAAHVFDHGAVGDLAVPLPHEGAWAYLRSTRLRVIVHPQRDLALIRIGDASLARRLRASWVPVPHSCLHFEAVRRRPPCVYAVAGYPVSQSRRIDGSVYMKPVVLFTRAIDAERLAYSRTAERVDGLHIHTPELDGVSGALVWALHEDESTVDCLLRAAAVQVSFAHDRYVRTEPLRASPLLFSHIGWPECRSADSRFSRALRR
jgi:hypothetical protein